MSKRAQSVQEGPNGPKCLKWSKIVQRVQNCPKVSKVSKSVQKGPKCPKVSNSVQRFIKVSKVFNREKGHLYKIEANR